MINTYYLKQTGLFKENIKMTGKLYLQINLLSLLKPFGTSFVTVTE